MRRKLLVLFETAWDRPQLEACRPAWEDRYEVAFADPSDAETPWSLDILAYVREEAERRRGRVDGVLSTSDYPGATTTALLAEALGLPGAEPRRVLCASHKYYSRLAQREVAPEAVPGFALIDLTDPGTWDPSIGFPCFVKPVKGAFSVMSGKMGERGELAAFLGGPQARWFREEFTTIFDRLVAHFGLEHDGRWFLAEELLHGRQATVEGWRTRTDSGTLGVVDSVFQPGTHSFVRFDYPSTLPAGVQDRMTAAADRVVEHLELADTLYNVEMVWDPDTDRLGIIEVNPRACGQFGDLYQKVDGVHGFEVALALAAGDPPPSRRREGAFGAAASFPLRVFEPSRVARAPGPDEVRAVLAEHPGALAWVECSTGDVLQEFVGLEDGASYRYAVLHAGGTDLDDVLAQGERLRAALDFRLEPVDPAAQGSSATRAV